MKVIKGNWNTLLSNHEVLDILQNMKSIKSCKNKSDMTPLATISYQTIKYFTDEKMAFVKQSPQKIQEFLKAVEPFKLTKAEKLTLLNLCPTTQLEIQLMVEESEERLTDEEVETLLQIITNVRKDNQNTEEET